MSKKIHYANFEIKTTTRKEMQMYKLDMEIHKSVAMTLEEIAVSAMMRGIQVIDRIEMARHPYPKGQILKKCIYRLSEAQAVQITNAKLRYSDKSPVPAMDKYRVLLEFGMQILRRDLNHYIRKKENGKVQEGA